MGFRLDDPLSEPLLQAWAGTDRRPRGTLARLEAIEEIISYWVPISQERDLRIEALERRLAKLEEDAIPNDYGCVAELAARVDTLEATVWELARRLGRPSAFGEPT